LAQDGEHLALAGPAVDLALDALPEVVGVDAGDGQAGLAQVAGQLAEVGAGGVVVVAGPVRLVLDEDDGPAAGGGGLEVADLLGEGGEVAAGGLEEGLARAAELDVLDVEQPGGQAAEV